jgi:hypothetical protein
MVDFGLSREVPRLLHFDAEFADAEDLVIETLVGRNMGWEFDERAAAMAHIARVMREDRGINPRRVKTVDGEGIPYRVAMAGNDPSLPFVRFLRVTCLLLFCHGGGQFGRQVLGD